MVRKRGSSPAPRRVSSHPSSGSRNPEKLPISILVNSLGQPSEVPLDLSPGQRARYQDRHGEFIDATVLAVHHEDGVPFYTIQLANGAEKQTVRERLRSPVASSRTRLSQRGRNPSSRTTPLGAMHAAPLGGMIRRGFQATACPKTTSAIGTLCVLGIWFLSPIPDYIANGIVSSIPISADVSLGRHVHVFCAYGACMVHVCCLISTRPGCDHDVVRP